MNRIYFLQHPPALLKVSHAGPHVTLPSDIGLQAWGVQCGAWTSCYLERNSLIVIIFLFVN